MNTVTRTVLLISTTSLLPVATVTAQEGAGVIEEVVVTARKRDESLQEVPIAITAFTEAQIQRAGIERPADFIALIPNVTIVDTANVGDTQVSIRGIVSTRDAESTFAYVVDGVLSTNPNSFNEELVDVQQIEVLKGPQGALYGRNAVAGAILVTTREPSEEFEANIKVGAGNIGQQKASVRLSGGLSDTFRASLVGSYRNQDGHYENIFVGGDDAVDYLEDATFRARGLWEPNDNLKVDFRAGASQVEGGAINFNAGFAIPALEVSLGSPAFNADVNDVPFIYAFNVPGENEQDTFDLAIKADWGWGDIGVTALVSFNDLEEYLLSDGTSATFFGYEVSAACQNDRLTLNNLPVDQGGAGRDDLFGPFFQPFGVFPPAGGAAPDFTGIYGPYTPTTCDGYQYQERNQRDTGFELRFTSPQDQELRWIAGVYAARIEREVVIAYGTDTGNGFLRQPYVDPTGPNPTDQLFWDEFDTDVIAVFGELAFDMGDSMELSLAMRWDQEDREVSNKVPAVLSSGNNINVAGQPINPAFNTDLDPIPSRSETFDQFQPKITWRWSATDYANVYASWGIGFRSGGFNNLGTEDLLEFWFNTGLAPNYQNTVNAQLQVPDEYDKEVSTAYELGVKTQFLDNRLRINAAVFTTDVEDSQFFEFFAGPFGILRAVTTIDETTISGFEADFAWQATDSFSLYGGLGLLDSEIERNDNRPASVGNDVPQAPDVTYNLGAQFDIELGADLGLFARLDWQHVGETWFHTLQGEETPTIWDALFGGGGFITQNFSKAQRDAYDTLNLRVGIEGERWRATAWGRNITDEEYLEEVIPAPEFGGSFLHQAAGDAYGVDFEYRF